MVGCMGHPSWLIDLQLWLSVRYFSNRQLCYKQHIAWRLLDGQQYPQILSPKQRPLLVPAIPEYLPGLIGDRIEQRAAFLYFQRFSSFG